MQFNNQLIAAASTMHYECATLPGRQLGVDMPPEPFISKQQRHSKLDGGVELCFLFSRLHYRATLEKNECEPAPSNESHGIHTQTFRSKVSIVNVPSLQVAAKLWQHAQLE